MATFIPALNNCKSKMTPGEMRFATRLHANLDEDFYCWYDVAIGADKARYPDFMILNADFGLLSIEVKDWKLQNIQSIDKFSASLTVGGGVRTLANPMEQSRQCTYKIIQLLEQDPDLLGHGGRYEGKLRFPYGYGVAFPNISSHQVAGIDSWDDIFPAHRVIYQDQMTEGVDSDEFRLRIEQFFDIRFGHRLTPDMIDRVRWHIFPEIRIADRKDLFDEDASRRIDTLDLSKIKQMDMEQEKCARQLGSGHRVIRGVAGSGKTQIIAYRCQYFAEASKKPILVLYFNIAAKALLKNALAARGILDRVHVQHFHRWCAEQLRSSGSRRGPDVVEAFACALAAKTIQTDRYSAVMVDEGQDFKQGWIKLIAEFCNAGSLPLLFVYDDAQSIYEKRTGLGFSMRSVGIEAQGRTKVMRINYRNTRYVQQLASRFLHEALQCVEKDDASVPDEEWLHPVSVGNTGTCPKIVLCDGARDEMARIAHWLHVLHDERSVPWSDICLILRTTMEAERCSVALEQQGIPIYNLSGSRDSKEALDLSDATVKITTAHSSKGLEFPYILIPHLCGFAEAGDRAIGDARLLYVAMTRSTHGLVLTAQRRTPLVDRMNVFIEEIRAAFAAETEQGSATRP